MSQNLLMQSVSTYHRGASISPGTLLNFSISRSSPQMLTCTTPLSFMTNAVEKFVYLQGYFKEKSGEDRIPPHCLRVSSDHL